MRKLTIPAFNELDLFDACTGEMDEVARREFTASRPQIQAAAIDFAAHSVTRTWCQLPRARHGHREEIVAGELSKGNLMDLYDEGVVKSKGRPRDIYDAILVAAQGRCPYCADIGTTRTLDHYLPKAKFPGLSVHPHNLVPACRDCNTDAGAGFPTSQNLQPIHPYLDKECFFSERWVHAKVIRCEPVVVSFFSAPPVHWPDIDQHRAKQHFIDCNLKDRFSSQVSGELGPLILQRKSSLAVFSPAQFEAHLRIIADDVNLLLNGWKRTMYLALCESDWFCSTDFAGDWLAN
ncbi:HNH endonuclease [Malikia spinosa]|uniref:HNH endonuclease n=1 Tax=Malikia spinosa TaxID=86180 RepID=UPI0011B057E6|nr:HNH endonuclease signature motif containing protein [Malikia spinosa]